ncbi:MAG: OmpA family protein [Terrimicrobiaceae bacterium]|nr:OmpA family protein [Terrimicrobiaceae bacterium]
MKKAAFLTMAAAVMFSMAACKKKTSDQFAGIDGDFVTGTPLGDRLEGANFFGSNVERGQFSPVYFGFDSYAVEPSEASKIQEVASAMRGRGNMLIVAGFTDDRGTEEYNRGLGERRALAVREALIAAGMRADRVQTVSFGEEMPADPGSGEAAWAKNRRAEFGIVR